MAYGDFKDLKKKNTIRQSLRNKAFEIASNPKYDGYQRGGASMVFNCLTRNQKKVVLKMK